MTPEDVCDNESCAAILAENEPESVGGSALLRLPPQERGIFAFDGGVMGVRNDKFFFPVGNLEPRGCPAKLWKRLERGNLTLIGPVGWLIPWEGVLPGFWRSLDYWFLSRPPQPMDDPVLPQGYRVSLASLSDFDRLFPLQAGYEKEEVALSATDFNPCSSSAAFRTSLEREKHWFLEADQSVLSKAATNARGFSWYQIGGVYTDPPERRKGWAKAVLQAAATDCAREGAGLCLFVKKENKAAQQLYENLGFSLRGEFRIVYYL